MTSSVIRLPSAPPTRGWSRRNLLMAAAVHVCPAYAGMVPTRHRRPASPGRLPRLRGDGPVTEGYVHQHITSAPPTRGWSLRQRTNTARLVVCPAYAGMVPSPRRGCGNGTRLPRLRGDGPEPIIYLGGNISSAPPTRGWPRNRAIPQAAATVCPAYAGMAPTSCKASVACGSLPRLRGDGPRVTPSSSLRRSSSPPTRGCSPKQE